MMMLFFAANVVKNFLLRVNMVHKHNQAVLQVRMMMNMRNAAEIDVGYSLFVR